MKKYLCILLCLFTLFTFTACNNSKEKSDGNLAPYDVSVIGAKYSNDSSEQRIIANITYKFTNNSNDNVSFDRAIEDEVYQNGIECDSLYNSESTALKKIKSGATVEIEISYKLNDSISDLQIELSKSVGLSSDKYETTIPINQIKK